MSQRIRKITVPQVYILFGNACLFKRFHSSNSETFCNIFKIPCNRCTCKIPYRFRQLIGCWPVHLFCVFRRDNDHSATTISKHIAFAFMKRGVDHFGFQNFFYWRDIFPVKKRIRIFACPASKRCYNRCHRLRCTVAVVHVTVCHQPHDKIVGRAVGVFPLHINTGSRKKVNRIFKWNIRMNRNMWNQNRLCNAGFNILLCKTQTVTGTGTTCIADTIVSTPF